MNLRIMVVDDSAVMTEMLKVMLEGSGHQMVAKADNTSTALSAYETHRPDLVLLDLTLKDDNGLDVLKALRQKDGQAKVIIVSANAQQKVRRLASAAGAADMLVKPLKMEELTAVINRLFPGK